MAISPNVSRYLYLDCLYYEQDCCSFLEEFWKDGQESITSSRQLRASGKLSFVLCFHDFAMIMGMGRERSIVFYGVNCVAYAFPKRGYLRS